MPDVVVVGGGVIGLSAAWRAAQRGMSVTVVDPAPGRGASWVAAGMLAPVTEATFGEEVLVRLAVAGAARWPSFAAELHAATGSDVGYRRCGTVMVAVDASDRVALSQVLAYQQQLGLEARELSSSACRRLVPALSPGIRSGAEIPGDHQVDNRRLLAALLLACRDAGVELVAASVEAVLTGPGGATGVRLAVDPTRSTSNERDLPAGAVLVAAGTGCGAIGGLPPGTLPPVRPVKGVVIRLQGAPGEPLLGCTVRGLVHGRPCYLVPRADGELVIGATAEERGFDRSVPAGHVHQLLDDARTLVPGIDELELGECLAGLRPGSPDNCPFVGWTSVPRLAVATGHYRNGILLAPLTADAIVGCLEGAAAELLAGVDPRRVLGRAVAAGPVAARMAGTAR